MTQSTDILVSVSNVSKHFDNRRVLDRVDLTLRAGQIVTLIGPNGSGKTSLVRLVLGLSKADHGTVSRQAGLRVGYMPQRLSVAPILPLTVSRFLALGGVTDQQAHRHQLQAVGAAELIGAPVQALSGGELQRVLLARALLRRPQLLVLDEPTQGVDAQGQSSLYRLIGQIREQTGCGVLMVSHDLHLVMAATDEVVCLNHHVCCSGHPSAVVKAPEYQALFGTESSLAIYAHHHDHNHDVGGDVAADCGHRHE
ncbi:MAG TPA: zinc ABC transporter ATP-binding protein ZnuC [Chromatiaceae bacterium]|nr:zinc ABC transporter ATP-binding protein ZnuC [Chromatiaceae bacterium]HIN82923.1 zinc ABC transporter ATP-binding protein ZnuC [Chromatiales bacterium]HIO54721.1 zinc ABC transporter ATP-binding protein ZnuC [Chromatiales bacterium]